MSKGKMGRYLLYALGEIILVVAGILIALAINNSNEAKKQDAELLAILADVKADLVLDTTLVGRIIPYYELREKIADSIIQNKMDREGLKACIPCHSLITTYYPFTVNDKGYEQLKGFNLSNNRQDTLAIGLVQFYNGFIPFIEKVTKEVENNTYETLKAWRDTQPWFAEIMSGTLPESYLDYISENPDYKNRVAFYDIIASKNLLVLFQQYKLQATTTIGEIEKRLEQSANQR